MDMRKRRIVMVNIICWLILSLCMTGCHSVRYHGPTSNHFNGQTFHNLGDKNKPKHPWYDLYVLLKAILQTPWPEPPVFFEITTPIQSHKGSEITFVGHSTFLIKTKYINILTDPVYSNRASPVAFLGPKRFTRPGISFDELPKIDVVVISHNHYDHMDLATLKKLNHTFHPAFIVPIGNASILKKAGIMHVIELDWWQHIKIKSVVITLLPAKHSSQRGWFDFNRSLWGAYGIQAGSEKIFFAGDTAYGEHFKAIQEKWGQPNLSLIPIGAYWPRDILKSYHMNPAEAVKAHLDLKSHKSIGMHWGTFHLSSEPIQQPLTDLYNARMRYNISKHSFQVLNFGDKTYVY